MPGKGDSPTRPVNEQKLRQKVHFIQNNVRRLKELSRKPKEEFVGDGILVDAAVRMLQVAIEAVLDSANHIIARLGLGLPQTYRDAVSILFKNGILPGDQEQTFLSMVRFRNRAVHLYEEITPDEVYDILQNHLQDFDTFIYDITRRFLLDNPVTQ